MENEKKVPVNFYIKDGILFGEYCEQFTMNLSTAERLLESRLKINQGKAYPAFFDFGRVEYSDKETRDFLLGRGTELLIATAFITKNPAFRIFLNSVVMVHKPKMPLRVFSTKEKAVEWLKQFVEKNN